jgi:hypothetical protein
MTNITVSGASEFSSLGKMCCPWLQCHEAAVIKMVYSAEENMFLVKRFYQTASIIMIQHELKEKFEYQKAPTQ